MKLKPSITAVLVFVAVQTAVYSQTVVFPRLQPDPKALEYYRLGANGGYSWTQLAQISLWASGDTSTANLDKIRAAADAIKNAADLPDTFEAKAEYVLTFMYKNLLKTYSLYQTRVDTMLSTGRYNCVSSAVLYMILCESIGIHTNGVMTKDHAFITIPAGDTPIDVETTNAYGFDPGNRKEFHDQFGKVTGFTYVPAKNYRDRETLSQIELVSLILNNRIADLERQNQFADAVPIAIDRAALLDGNELKVDSTTETHRPIFSDPRIDLLDRLYNYGAMLLRAGKEEDCLRWAATASPLYPDEKRWQEFTMAAVNNNLTKLLKANKFADARNFLDRQKPVLSQANFDKLDTLQIEAELTGKANQIRTAADGDAVVNAIDQARKDGKITDKRAVELITFAVQKTASSVSTPPGGNWRAAIQYIQTSLSRFGANRELEQALNMYRNNLATDYHNRFATEWNKKNLTEAERILNEGLAEFPNDRQLLSDKQIIAKQGR